MQSLVPPHKYFLSIVTQSREMQLLILIILIFITNDASCSNTSNSVGLSPIRTNKTLEVFVGFYIESLGDLRATEMAYDVDMYFKRSWRDPSLAHGQDQMQIVSESKLLDTIWVPDIYFANAKTAVKQDVTVPNAVMYIYSDGTVSLSSRVTLNVACTLRLENYPMDEQSCTIRILSYGYPSNRVRLYWLSEPISYNPDIELPEFYIPKAGMKAEYCNGKYTYAQTRNHSEQGDWSCLLAVIKFKRAIGYHLVQTYIPTGMMVMISWIGFWIDPKAVPARVSISFTTLLTLSTMGAGLRYALPPVSYAKAIDYWFGVCLVFVFAALLEFAVVSSLVRHNEQKEEKTQELSQKAEKPYLHPPEIIRFMDTSLKRVRKQFSYTKCADTCDKVCRFAFPLAFLVFNSIYWLTYLK